MAIIGSSWAAGSWIGGGVWADGAWATGAWISGSVWEAGSFDGWERYAWGILGWGESGWVDGSWADIIPPITPPEPSRRPGGGYAYTRPWGGYKEKEDLRLLDDNLLEVLAAVLPLILE